VTAPQKTQRLAGGEPSAQSEVPNTADDTADPQPGQYAVIARRANGLEVEWGSYGWRSDAQAAAARLTALGIEARVVEAMR
jgi:hypothetical protein